MNSIIIQVSEILKDEFGIKPQRTNLYLYENIQKLLNKTNNPQAQSIFFTKDLSAHTPNNRLDLIFHEYHGHGLYCEYANYGKKMVEDEQKLGNMNQEELQKLLNLNELMKPD